MGKVKERVIVRIEQNNRSNGDSIRQVEIRIDPGLRSGTLIQRNINHLDRVETEHMKNRVHQSYLAGGFIVFLAMVLVGCETCKPGQPGPIGKYDIEVALDDSLKTSSVIVDLVGVNGSSLPRWEAYDMSKYWKENDPMRRDADKVVLNFVSGQSLTKTLAISDEQWGKWKSKGVTYVLVLADLPGAQTSKPGTQDARRQILSLDQCNWPAKTSALKVLVQRSGMVVLTAPRAVKSVK